MPGAYTVRLTADGETAEQPLVVKMDPRVTTSPAELQRQFDLSMRLYGLLRESFDALQEAQALAADPANAALSEQAAAFASRFRGLNGGIGGLFRTIQGVDLGPTSQVVAAAGNAEGQLRDALAEWEALRRN
jgi:hypothetical protein